MDRMIYLAMSGAKQTQLAQAAATHNLANANTTGFRADLAAFRSMPVFGPGHPSRVFAMTERPGIDFSQGPITTTGNELDLAINGDGWLAVLAPDGTEAYTRAGNLRLSANGLLQTGAGHLVLGNGGPIAIPPAEKMEIGVDGTLSLRPLGQTASTLATVDRIKLVNPPVKDLEKGADGLFRLRDGSNVPADAKVKVISGALEGSNVNAVEQMVNMIAQARQFELQIKAMQTVEEIDSAEDQILRMNQ